MTPIERLRALGELHKAKFKDNPDYALDPVSKRYKRKQPKDAPKKGRKAKAPSPVAAPSAPPPPAHPDAATVAAALQGIDWAGPKWRVEADPDGRRVHASWGLVYTGYIDIGSTHPLASYDRLTPSARLAIDDHLATAGYPVEALTGDRPSPDQAAIEWARNAARTAERAVKGLKAKAWHGARWAGKPGQSAVEADRARVYLSDFGGSKKSPKRDLGYIDMTAPDPYATVHPDIRDRVRP